MEKDPTLSVPLIKGLIKFWPTTNSQKELLFLQEVEELLELTQPEEFHQLTPVLFRQLSKSIGSPHFQVAERALFLWHNEYISGLISENRAQVLPLIYPVLQTNAKHWNSTVSSLTNNVLKIFMGMYAYGIVRYATLRTNVCTSERTNERTNGMGCCCLHGCVLLSRG